MKRKTGFTLEQHQRAGATLLRAEAEVRKVLAALYRSYIINSGEGAKVIRLLDGIGHYDLFTARDNLAALMERENPHANCSDTYFDDRPYYPPLADEDESLTFRHVPFVKRVHRKTGFTMDDHRIAGAILRRVRRELATLIVATSRAYAFSGGRAGTATNAMRRAERRVVKAQSALEEIMAKEHPAEWSAQVYYGGHESLSV